MAELSLKTISRGAKISVLLLGFGVAFTTMALWFPYAGYMASLTLGQWLIIMVSSMAAVVFLHEGLHGLFFRMFGGGVRFGAKWTKLGPAFFATSPSDYSRRQMQLIALAPQILSIVCLGLLISRPPPMVALGLIICGAGNLGGGCFDLYTVFWLNKFPKGARCQDIQDGVRIVATSSAA